MEYNPFDHIFVSDIHKGTYLGTVPMQTPKRNCQQHIRLKQLDKASFSRSN